MATYTFTLRAGITLADASFQHAGVDYDIKTALTAGSGTITTTDDELAARLRTVRAPDGGLLLDEGAVTSGPAADRRAAVPVFVQADEPVTRPYLWEKSFAGIATGVRQYGAVDGSTLVVGDSGAQYVAAGLAAPGAAVTAAIAALGVAGGTVILQPGVHTWESIPQLPPSLTGKLSIQCAPGATIKLTAGAPRAFDWGKTADYQTFRHIDLGPLTVDCNSIGGKHHVVIGTWQNGSWQTRLNMDDVHVHDVRILNAPVGTDANVDFRIGVAMTTSAALADTKCTFTNSSVRRISSDGCLQLIAVNAPPVGSDVSANVTHDNITVEAWQHLIPTVPTAAGGGGHVMCGTKGQGGRLSIRNGQGTNSTDVGIEVDGWAYAVVDDILVEDAFDVGGYFINYTLPESVEAQQVVLSNVLVRRRNLNDHGRGFQVGVNNAGSAPNGNRAASVHFGPGCVYHRLATSLGHSIQYEALDLLGSRRVTGSFQAVLELPDYAGGTDVSPSAIRMRSPDTSSRLNAGLRTSVKVTGSRSGTGLVNWNDMVVREGLIRLNLDHTSDVAISNAGNSDIVSLDIGATTGGAGSAVLSGQIKLDIVPGSRGNVPVGIRFESGTINVLPASNDEITVYDSNFAGLAAASTELDFKGATTLSSKVRLRNNLWRTYPQARRPVAASVSIDAKADLVAVTDTSIARTLTLPAVALIPPGRVIRFKDESGHAGTSNITINANGADTIEGAASSVINTNYGSVAIQSTGAAWVKAA